MINHFTKLFAKLIVAFGISLALTTSCYALGLTSSTSKSFFKTLANGNDLVCQSDEGEMDIDADRDPLDDTVVSKFVMESPIDPDTGTRVSHTCCEVPHTEEGEPGYPGLSVADCEADDPADGCGYCGEFTLDQKVEDSTTDGVNAGDDVPSNCLEVDGSGGLSTYRCQVSKGAPKENWVWHLTPTPADAYKFCDTTGACGSCGTAMGTTSNAKPGDYPYGVVWQYNEYKNSDGEILLADFNGSWCHTGSFCLDDEIQCSVNKAKVDLRTDSTAEFIVIEVDTVNRFNADSTTGSTPTDLFSLVDDGELLVDATLINTDNITINGSPVAVRSSNAGDHNGDGVADLRTQLSTADFQYALYPLDDCTTDKVIDVVFKGTLNDPDDDPSTPDPIWIAFTTVNVVCN